MSLILLTSITPSDDATFLLSSTFLSLTSVGELKDVWLVSKGMDREQPFHCDGTDHAVTLTTVRDHKPRRLICMFYPEAITREMGPTAVSTFQHLHLHVL